MHPFGAQLTHAASSDGCTAWKSACLHRHRGQIGTLLCRPLRQPFAFSTFPYPMAPQVTLRLPCPAPKRGRAMGLSTFPDLPTTQRGRAACLLRVCLSWIRRVATCPHDQRGQLTSAFWLWPDSSFGQSMVVQVQTAVHLTYPYRTSLAPQPPSAGSIRTALSRAQPAA